jgi:hypothetical protein
MVLTGVRHSDYLAPSLSSFLTYTSPRHAYHDWRRDHWLICQGRSPLGCWQPPPLRRDQSALNELLVFLQSPLELLQLEPYMHLLPPLISNKV